MAGRSGECVCCCGTRDVAGPGVETRWDRSATRSRADRSLKYLSWGPSSLSPLTEDLEGRARRSASGGPGADVLGVVGQGPGGRWPSSERRKGGLGWQAVLERCYAVLGWDGTEPPLHDLQTMPSRGNGAGEKGCLFVGDQVHGRGAHASFELPWGRLRPRRDAGTSSGEPRCSGQWCGRDPGGAEKCPAGGRENATPTTDRR